MKQQQFSSAALSHLPALVVLVLGLSAAKTGFVAGASSPLKKPPGEDTGPTIHADSLGNLVGRVPSRGERDVLQQAARAAVPPAITCPGSLDLESREGSIATIRVNVRDDDGNPLVVVWTVDGISYQVNNAPGGVTSVITSEGLPTNSVPATGTGSGAGFEEWRAMPGINPAPPPTVTSVDFTANYGLGEHDVVVSVSDGTMSPD